MGTIFSDTLVKLRQEAGFPTAYRFFHDNGGDKVLGMCYRKYLMMEQGRNLPVLGRLERLIVGLHMPFGTPAARELTLAWLKTMAGEESYAGLLEPLMGNQTLLMLVIVGILLIIGMGMDLTPTILVLTPVLLPVVKMAGIDPVYFGVIFIVTGSIGLITPPVGTVLNVVCGITKLTMEDLTKGVWPFLFTEIVILLLFVIFPKLVTVPARWFFG